MVRWKKIWGDLKSSKIRTLLVVLSISVGVVAIGAIAGSYIVFSRDMQESFLSIKPANITVYSDPFQAEDVEAVRNIRGVVAADGRRTLGVRLKLPSGEWKALNLTVIPDYEDIRVNHLKRMSGAWPPPERGVLLERSSLSIYPFKTGESLLIEAPDGKQRNLKVSGMVHDISQIPSFFSGTLNGYITFDTLEALGEKRELDTMLVMTDSRFQSKDELASYGRQVWDKVERSGRKVYWTMVLPPGEHPLHSAFQAILFVLMTMGGLTLLLSGFLLVNTVTAILTQQMRQIGIMKAVGGRTGQIMRLYMANVLCYSLLALLIAVPLGAAGAQLITFYQAELANIEVKGFQIVPEVVALQAVVAIGIPVAAALIPLWKGTRISVKEALGSYGIQVSRGGRLNHWVDESVEWLARRFRALTRPLLLSLRNTFRRKGRLALTLATLTLGGAIFISVASIGLSLKLTTDELFEYFNYDLSLVFNKEYRLDRTEQEALRVPGVTAVESWGYSMVRILRGRDENNSEQMTLYAPRADTRMVNPKLVSGRWLVPEDENALVINTDVIKKVPGIKVGDTVTVKLEGKKHQLKVVGVVRSVMTGPSGYINFPYFGYITGGGGKASSIQAITEKHDGPFQVAAARSMEQQMKRAGIKLNFLQTTQEIKDMIVNQFNVIVIFMYTMAALLALVGALGLAGSMSINVVERTREIGVMRAIGASNWEILRMVMVEGLLTGAISWLLSVAVALPVSKLLSHQVGMLFIEAPLTYQFSIGGMLIWLVLVLVLSGAATWWPAKSAVSISVRDALSYE